MVLGTIERQAKKTREEIYFNLICCIVVSFLGLYGVMLNMLMSRRFNVIGLLICFTIILFSAFMLGWGAYSGRKEFRHMAHEKNVIDENLILKKQVLELLERLKEKEINKSPRIAEIVTLLQEEGSITKEMLEPLEIIDEEPIALMMISEDGTVLFTYSFIDELNFENDLFGGFLIAFKFFSSEVFSEGLDRAKFGDYSVLLESVSNFTLCYLFKGQVYLAKQKLSHLTEQIRNDASIIPALTKFQETSRAANPKDIPLLDTLITEIFIKRFQIY